MVLKVERFKTNRHRRLVFRQLRSTKYTPLEVIYIYIPQVTRSPMDFFSQLSSVKQIEPLTDKKWCLDPIQSSMTITLQSGYGGIHVPPSGWVAANDGAFPPKTSPKTVHPLVLAPPHPPTAAFQFADQPPRQYSKYSWQLGSYDMWLVKSVNPKNKTSHVLSRTCSPLLQFGSVSIQTGREFEVIKVASTLMAAEPSVWSWHGNKLDDLPKQVKNRYTYIFLKQSPYDYESLKSSLLA